MILQMLWRYCGDNTEVEPGVDQGPVNAIATRRKTLDFTWTNDLARELLYRRGL